MRPKHITTLQVRMKVTKALRALRYTILRIAKAHGIAQSYMEHALNVARQAERRVEDNPSLGSADTAAASARQLDRYCLC